MAGRSPWVDGRRAWERNYQWYSWDPRATPSPSLDPSTALTSLEDFRLVQNLLDVARTNLVLLARKGGCTWAEIATRVGISEDEARTRWGREEARLPK